jgi:hypothetical protein
MKHLHRLFLITTLIITFAVSAYAGKVDCPGITESQLQAAGEIQYDVTQSVLWLILALI